MAKTIDLMMSLKDGVSPKLSNINNNLQTTSGKIKGLSKSVISFGNIMKTAFIGGTIATFAKNAMEAYDTQILAEKSLERTLKSTGKTAQQASEDLQEYKDFASKQQSLTAFGDESTLAVISDLIGQGFGKKHVKDIVAMSQDLARGTGDTQENVTKALSAYVKTGKGATKLSKAYKLNADLLGKGTTESERMAEVWKALNQGGYIGASADYMKTFTGQMEAISGRLADLNEPVGQLFQTLLGFDTAGNFAQQLDDTIVNLTSDIQGMADRSRELGGGISGVASACAEAHPQIALLLGVLTAGKTITILGSLATSITAIGTAISGLAGIVGAVGGSIIGFVGTLIASIIQMKKWVEQSQEVRNELDKQNALSYGVSGGWTSGATAFENPNVPHWYDKTDHNASGTNYFGGGLTEVGEHGGEILNLPNGTQIIPNDISQKMTGGTNVSVNLTVQGNVIGNDDFINEVGNAITNRVQLALSNC